MTATLLLLTDTYVEATECDLKPNALSLVLSYGTPCDGLDSLNPYLNALCNQRLNDAFIMPLVNKCNGREGTLSRRYHDIMQFKVAPGVLRAKRTKKIRTSLELANKTVDLQTAVSILTTKAEFYRKLVTEVVNDWEEGKVTLSLFRALNYTTKEIETCGYAELVPRSCALDHRCRELRLELIRPISDLKEVKVLFGTVIILGTLLVAIGIIK